MEHPSIHMSCVTSYNISSKDGQTPLLLAIRKKNIAIVSEVVAVRADVNYMEDVSETIFIMCVHVLTVHLGRYISSDALLH